MARYSQIGSLSGIAESIVDDDLPRDLEKVKDSWKDLAKALGYTGPVAWRVGGGFSFKTDFPAMVEPHDRTLRLMQKWAMKNDEPTQRAIVFWIPKPLNDDFSAIRPRLTVVEDLRSTYGLPGHHLANLGSAALVSALLLAGAKEGKLHPSRFGHSSWVGFPTDTMTNTGFRVHIRYHLHHKRYFKCLRWNEDGIENNGFFPLGIELGR